MDASVTFHLEVFDGPLDLLLHLIAKNKVEIKDIPIALILTQYMAYLDVMKRMDLEITSEFIVMASQLVYIKTSMLLPAPEAAEDPRAGLVRSLEEYKRFRDYAPGLARRYACGVAAYTRMPEPTRYELPFSNKPADLSRAVAAMRTRQRLKLPPPIAAFEGQLTAEPVPVEAKMTAIVRRVRRGGLRFRDAFLNAVSRSELVAIFLAVLELLRARRINLRTDDGEMTLTDEETK